jgi:hypothetical protein
MTLPRADVPLEPTVRTHRLGRDDPLLQELWAAKADMNAAAGYDVARLVETANGFDLETTVALLRRQAGH